MSAIIEFITSADFLLYMFMSLVPILGWLYFFQSKHREKRSYVALTFLAGMLSVVPIKLYEKYWDSAIFYFEHINLFEYLSALVHLPEMPRFLAFVTVNALVGIGLFLFTGLMMFVLEVCTGDNSIRLFRQKVRKIIESPLFFISIGILCGIVAYVLSFGLDSRVWFFVIVGMLEEFIKHLVLRFSDEEKIRSVDDALSYAIIVALGFAFVENILYFHNFAENTSSSLQQLSLFFILRSTVSVMAHVCFSAVLGYFYGLARFSHEIYQVEAAQNQHPFIDWMHRVLHMKGETIYHEEKMMEGMLLAMVLHAVFNSLLEFGLVTWMVIFLLVLFFLVLNLFHRKQVYAQSGYLLSSGSG